MENGKKANLNVVLEVKATNYANGKLKTVFGGKGQITKDNAGRVSQKDEDTIKFAASDCAGTLEAEYNSVSIGRGEVKTDVELDMKVQYADMNKGELIDAIATGSKLTKADAGRSLDTAIEDVHKLIGKRDCDAQCATIDSWYTTKNVELVK